MTISQKDKELLRSLAEQVAEIASLPVMAKRKEMWKRHNQLERVRPMILVFPEGSWRELLPQSELKCEGQKARRMEWNLRSRIYYYERIHDDTVIENKWIVNKVVTNTGWGLQPRHKPSSSATGAWGFDPVIKTPEDLKKLKFPEVQYDETATQRNLEEAQEIFGNILDVKLKGISRVSFHLMNLYCQLRGLEQVMLDMYENPTMLHDAMSFLEEGNHRLIKHYEQLNLLSLNSDGTYHSSGGVGYTDELPKSDYNPERIRPCDMWASAEAQEMAQVSPEMHNEFILQYEKRLLKPFGLNGYGCCEDLTDKLDYVFSIPNIRRISISPWADVDKCAEKLKGNYIFSWKPHPSHLVGKFNAQMIRKYIKHTLDVTKDRTLGNVDQRAQLQKEMGGKDGVYEAKDVNCVIEMILKDTHTCENHPERFTMWTDIAQELVVDY